MNHFANEPTKRFYHLLNDKVQKGEITVKEIADVMDAYKTNPSNFLSAMKTGRISVTTDQILKAEEKWGLNPVRLFSHNPVIDELTVLNDEEVIYKTNATKRISNIIREIIREKNLTIEFISQKTGYDVKYIG